VSLSGKREKEREREPKCAPFFFDAFFGFLAFLPFLALPFLAFPFDLLPFALPGALLFFPFFAFFAEAFFFLAFFFFAATPPASSVGSSLCGPSRSPPRWPTSCLSRQAPTTWPAASASAATAAGCSAHEAAARCSGISGACELVDGLMRWRSSIALCLASDCCGGRR